MRKLVALHYYQDGNDRTTEANITRMEITNCWSQRKSATKSWRKWVGRELWTKSWFLQIVYDRNKNNRFSQLFSVASSLNWNIKSVHIRLHICREMSYNKMCSFIHKIKAQYLAKYGNLNTAYMTCLMNTAYMTGLMNTAYMTCLMNTAYTPCLINTAYMTCLMNTAYMTCLMNTAYTTCLMNTAYTTSLMNQQIDIKRWNTNWSTHFKEKSRTTDRHVSFDITNMELQMTSSLFI